MFTPFAVSALAQLRKPACKSLFATTTTLFVLLCAFNNTFADSKFMASISGCSSYQDPNLPANTVDGNLATRWSAQNDGQWIAFDLGSSNSVTLLKIAFYSGDSRISYFDIQTSNDGSTWTNTATSLQSGGTTPNPETFDIPDASARYIKFVGHCNSANTWNSITEFEIWGVTAGDPVYLSDLNWISATCG